MSILDDLARAICCANLEDCGRDPCNIALIDYGSHARRVAAAYNASLAAHGYKIVPVEATMKMQAAMDGSETMGDGPGKWWRAAIGVSPQIDLEGEKT